MSAPSESFRIRIEPQGWEFSCPAQQTLLLAALDAGYRLPHACRNGSCRACMARLLEGRIDYRVEWPGLLREEKDAGWILPCVASPRSELRLEAPQAVVLVSAAAARSGPGPGSGSAA